MPTIYYKSRMPSKADLTANWRTPRATTGGKPPANVFRAFTKKAPLVNPYPAHPHLWRDLTIYEEKCELCKTNVRPAVFPQVLNTCKHVFCAKCIHNHYVVANKEQCPKCAAYIDPSDNPSYYDADERYHMRFDDGREEEWSRGEVECPCGWGYCDGDCGTLPCGCIDTCRGKCEL